MKLTDDRNCHRAVKHHNLKRCAHHIKFEMAARVEAVWNSERVLRVIATYWSKSLRREMDRSEAVRGCREQRAGSRVQRTECKEQRAES